MKKYNEILKNCLLFENISEEVLTSLINSANYYVKQYKKNEIILHEGSYTKNIGIIINGEIVIFHDDMDGNTFLKSKLIQSNSFAHVFAITSKPSTCNVISQTDTTILFLDINKLLQTNNEDIKNNIISFLAKTAYATSEHLSTLSLKTLRKKILTYINNYNNEDGKWFEVPLDRQQMADYLGINRTSLSKELATLKNESVIDYKKNKFIILNTKYVESQI